MIAQKSKNKIVYPKLKDMSKRAQELIGSARMTRLANGSPEQLIPEAQSQINPNPA